LAALLVLALAACAGGAPAAPAGSSSGIPSSTASTDVSTAASSPGAVTSTTIATPSVDRVSLTIYAAASLKAVLANVQAAYEAAVPGITLTISTDSSSALETKIAQGAPADVFLSADTSNPQKLVDGGLAAGPVVHFAGNLLTVIVPTSNPAGIVAPADLARPGVKIIAAGESVPIAKYAAQLVANLATQPGYPAGFAAAYQANVVSREDNVGAVLNKVALGEGDAGVVYVTDAQASKQVVVIAVPPGANVPATYGGVVVGASAGQRAATTFLAWLAGPGGQSILASFGFVPAP
jgi:molybdate transport system substrate-binding protein